MSDKIAEIRARHEEGIRAGADADRAYLLAEVDRLREEIEDLRTEVERSQQENALMKSAFAISYTMLGTK